MLGAEAAEAMVDEVTLLEAALREATNRKRGLGFGGGHVEASPMGAEERYSDVGGVGMEGFDRATISYGTQLKAWIDMQVDARLNAVLPSILDKQVGTLQQESVATIRMYQRLEGELELVKSAQCKLFAVVEGASEEISQLKVQGEALAAVEKIMLTVEELKQSVSLRDNGHSSDLHLGLAEIRRLHDSLHSRHESGFSELRLRLSEMEQSHNGIMNRHEKHEGHFSDFHSAIGDIRRLQNGLQESHHSGLAELHRLHGESHDRSLRGSDELSEASASMLAMRKEVSDLISVVQDHEQKLHSWRAEITAEVAQEMRTIGNLQETEAVKSRELRNLQIDVRGDLESVLEGFRSDLMKAAKRVDLEECRLEFRELVRELEGATREDLNKQQQRLIAELRAETSTAFRSEAAAVAALDEQLWLTDQRLGQRIDELSHSHRETMSVVERRIGTVLQNRLGRESTKERSEASNVPSPLGRAFSVTSASEPARGSTVHGGLVMASKAGEAFSEIATGQLDVPKASEFRATTSPGADESRRSSNGAVRGEGEESLRGGGLLRGLASRRLCGLGDEGSLEDRELAPATDEPSTFGTLGARRLLRGSLR